MPCVPEDSGKELLGCGVSEASAEELRAPSVCVLPRAYFLLLLWICALPGRLRELSKALDLNLALEYPNQSTVPRILGWK